MAMIKVVSPSGWDFDCPVASMVKVSRAGLVGHDRRAFIKRAASNAFLPYLDSVKFAEDEIPVHLIALGASEAYGFNRNGDGFKEACCKSYHDTFVKFARFYRNHKNKDPQISYGVVKLSAYNPTMRRVELLCALNATKAAAERNGGFVADREIEKLSRDEDLDVSMACRVPYDECSYCHNKARTRDEYCKSASCGGGGCYDNLTRVIKQGGDIHHMGVYNPHPTWFDISDVFRRADRIAQGGKADYLLKAAFDSNFSETSGAKLAEDLGIMPPLPVILAQENMLPGQWGPYMTEQIKLAYGLDMLERQMRNASTQDWRAFDGRVQPPMDFGALGLDAEAPEKVAAALGALADCQIVLPLREFARLTKRAEMLPAAAQRLPGVYGRMIADGTLERRLTDNRYAPAEKLATAKQRREAVRMMPTYSLAKEAVQSRSYLSVIRQHEQPQQSAEKQAADVPGAEELARDYAVYKTAALRRIAALGGEFLLTARLSISQNQAV